MGRCRRWRSATRIHVVPIAPAAPTWSLTVTALTGLLEAKDIPVIYPVILLLESTRLTETGLGKCNLTDWQQAECAGVKYICG